MDALSGALGTCRINDEGALPARSPPKAHDRPGNGRFDICQSASGDNPCAHVHGQFEIVQRLLSQMPREPPAPEFSLERDVLAFPVA